MRNFGIVLFCFFSYVTMTYGKVLCWSRALPFLISRGFGHGSLLFFREVLRRAGVYKVIDIIVLLTTAKKFCPVDNRAPKFDTPFPNYPE